MKTITKVLIVSGIVVGVGAGIYFYKKNKNKSSSSEEKNTDESENKSSGEESKTDTTSTSESNTPSSNESKTSSGGSTATKPVQQTASKPSPEKAVDNLVTVMYNEMNRVNNFFKSSRVSQDSAALISAKYIKQVNKATDVVKGKKLNDSQKDKMLAITLYKTQLSNKLKSSGFVLANKGNQYVLAHVKTPNKQVAVV